MAKASPIITSFNSGELSPLMAGRVDTKYYPNGSRKMRNFIPTSQGPARRRPGTRFAAEVKDSNDYTWLATFQFNVTQSYVLEFGDQYIRFFSNHGVVGAPFEVATPYVLADLTQSDGTFALRFVGSDDVLYIVHELYPPQKLTRTGAATFTIAEVDFYCGPFKDIDPDTATTVYSSAVSGVVTLTASAAIFTNDHVGTDFFLEQKNTDAIAMWESGKVVGAGAVRRSDGKNYTTAAGGTTGGVKPTHSRGSKLDGDTGVSWTFNDPGYGWARISAIGGGGTTATATVIARIPDGATGAGNATTRWAHAAWSDAEGWPDTITFFRERLSLFRNRKGWCSVAADFENFARKDDGGVITAEMALVFDITSDRANEIEWAVPSDQALLIGTAGDEHAISEISSAQAFGPGNAKAKKQSDYGSKHIPVQRVGDGVVFAQKAGRKLRYMRMAESINEQYVSPDITVLAEHVTKGGIVDMCYAQEPDSTLFAVKTDGQLIGMTLNTEQDVRGWHPHRIGGYSDVAQSSFAVVEAVASIPSPDGDRDEVWMIVRRYINGATKRYVEWMEYHHEEGDDPQDAFYMDCGLTLDNTKNATLTPSAGATVKGTAGVVFTAGSAIFALANVGRYIHYRYYTVSVTGKKSWHTAVAKITGYTDTTHVTCTINAAFPDLSLIPANGWRMTVTTITGLGHLEGQTVQVVGDGAAYPNAVVSGGSITLAEPASKVHVGLACTAVLQPMGIESGAQDGTAQGKTKRGSRLIIRFHETLGAKYGRDEDAQLDEILTRGGSDNMDEAPPLFTGDKVVAWPDGYDGQLLITVVQPQPLPCTVVALMPQMNTQDSR